MFHQSIELLLEQGVTDMVVLGPHRALRYILMSHLEEHSNVRVHASSSIQELRTIVRELA